MNEKFKVDFSKGVAINNNTEFEIFTDTRGLKIFTDKGVVFLTEKKCGGGLNGSTL